MTHRTDWHSEVIAVILAFAAVGLGLAVFSFLSKARNSVRSLSILILSPVSCGANLPVLHLSLASPVAHFLSTSRQRAKSTAGTERIGHGGATHQTANLCSKLNYASLPRPQGRAGRACSSSRIWRTTGYRCGTGPFLQ